MLEFLRSVSAPAVDAVLRAAADARQVVDDSSPTQYHHSGILGKSLKGNSIIDYRFRPEAKKKIFWKSREKVFFIDFKLSISAGSKKKEKLYFQTRCTQKGVSCAKC